MKDESKDTQRDTNLRYDQSKYQMILNLMNIWQKMRYVLDSTCGNSKEIEQRPREIMGGA
jgi:hypothetical protein